MRFSILSLLFAITIIGLAVSHYRTSGEFQRVKRELSAAKRELAYLEIEDDDRVYAVSLPSFDARQWRWRIRLPSSSNYQIMSSYGAIPIEGFPTTGQSEGHILRDNRGKQRVGEFILTIAVHQNESGIWCQTVKVSGESYSAPIVDPPSWLDNRSFVGWQTSVYGANGTVSCSPKENLKLLSYRMGDTSNGRTSIVLEPTPGMMFWIAPVD